jgi:hypothetical protein
MPSLSEFIARHMEQPIGVQYSEYGVGVQYSEYGVGVQYSGYSVGVQYYTRLTPVKPSVDEDRVQPLLLGLVDEYIQVQKATRQ